MPVREARIDDCVDALGLQRIADVEQDAVARAGASRDLPVREGGDVVAVIGLAGFLGHVAVVAAAPQAGQRAGLVVGEHCRAVDDAGPGRIGDRDLDDVDAEQRGALVAGRFVDAAFQFGLFADRTGTGVVDHDALVVARHHRMGVRAAAGLHGGDLPGLREVADVEHAQAAEAFLRDVFHHALQAAVQPAAGFLDRHQQQVADDGHVALAARADHRADQRRHAIGAEAVGVEAVVVADHQHVAGKRHVGVGEAQQAAAPAAGGFTLVALERLVLLLLRQRVGVLLLVVDRFQRQVGGIRRVEETGRLRQRRDQPQVGDGGRGIAEAGGEAGARIAADRGQHRGHALDLRGLVVADVVDELEQGRIVGRPALLQQVFDHRQRTGMVADHQLQEHPVEVGAFGLGQCRHLRRCRHAGHAVHLVRAVHGRVRLRIRHGFATRGQPLLHEGDLVALRGFDAPGGVDQRRRVGARSDQRGQFQRLVVVRDHVAHEPRIRGGVAGCGDLHRLVGRQLARLLARRTRVDDARLGHRRRDRRDQQGGEQAGRKQAHARRCSGTNPMSGHGVHPVAGDEGRRTTRRGPLT